jgi:hypothetical protein
VLEVTDPAERLVGLNEIAESEVEEELPDEEEPLELEPEEEDPLDEELELVFSIENTRIALDFEYR